MQTLVIANQCNTLHFKFKLSTISISIWNCNCIYSHQNIGDEWKSGWDVLSISTFRWNDKISQCPGWRGGYILSLTSDHKYITIDVGSNVWDFILLIRMSVSQDVAVNVMKVTIHINSSTLKQQRILLIRGKFMFFHS